MVNSQSRGRERVGLLIRVGGSKRARTVILGYCSLLLFAVVQCSPRSSPAAGGWDNAVCRERVPKATHVVSMAADGCGGAWIGTEDTGVFHYVPGDDGDNRCAQYTRTGTGGSEEVYGPALTTGTPSAQALGDDYAYALAVDPGGRLWVGHLNHGVSVRAGGAWRNYDVLSGPLGERIFAIACNPVDGSVWMASSAGLARYIPATGEWRYYTRADGLPEDQAASLAFDENGRLYIGTQCHGIVIAPPRTTGNNIPAYARWRHITAPDRFGPDGRWRVPPAPRGNGLPTNMINEVMVGRDGTVWAATTTGLAWSKDRGGSWEHLRGKNYAAKIEKSRAGAPPGWKKPSPRVRSKLLPEDYITCIAETPAGEIVLGTRRRGFMVLDPENGHRFHGTVTSVGLADNYVSAVVPLPGGRLLVGSYGGGVAEITVPGGWGGDGDASAKAIAAPGRATKENPGMPKAAAPPATEAIEALRRKHAGTQRLADTALAAYLGEDWMTWGDWVGRYGEQMCINCAANSPRDVRSIGTPEYYVTGYIGPHHRKGDGLRRWCPKPGRTKFDIHRSLWILREGTRRQSSWDDHGEAYPREYQGPGIWLKLDFPEGGLYRLCLYFFNNDGQHGNNRLRDYLVTVCRNPMSSQIKVPPSTKNAKKAVRRCWIIRAYDKDNIAAAHRSKIICRTRVRNFHGGVYKTFLLKNPGSLFVNIRKNYSFNIKFSGILVSNLTEGAPYPGSTPGMLPYEVLYRNDAYERLTENYTISENETVRTAMGLWARLKTPSINERYYNVLYRNRLLAYRAALHGKASGELLYDWRWVLKLWTHGDRKEFQDAMRFHWYISQKWSMPCRRKDYRALSPNVYKTAEEWEKHKDEFKPEREFRTLD